MKKEKEVRDIESLSDDDLVSAREEMVDQIEIWLGHEYRREEFRELLEIERELTLREC